MTASYFVYIIYSRLIDQFYVGSTSSITGRLDKHLEHYYAQSFTTKADDWDLFFSLACNSKSQALRIEKHIKLLKSRRYFQNLRAYPEMGEKLLARYS
jgi:putative endonuclease